jgi:molybdopterin-containing oxidoreductase family iron-sulfur binding subunit
MKITRKDFLRLSGLSLLAAGAVQAVRRELRAAPAQAPQAGVRWGMVIDLAKCRRDSGCDRCIRACHEAHNVPRIANPRHEIKWIWKQPLASIFPFVKSTYAASSSVEQQAPLLCNHCAQSPCTRVCPTQATWKREDGIVMMDWHRCIGCRYCMAACPYGSRSFNWEEPRPALASIDASFPTRSKGVVEKCNFCAERIARNQLPACVLACPEKAMVFGNLDDPQSAPRALLRERFAVQRQPELGTNPSVFYLV